MRAIHFIFMLAAIGVAIVLVQGDSKPSRGSGYDMLAELDAKVANQEDVKDVRCWSSFCKLQMFLTEMEIEPDAVAERIDGHMDLIQSIWADSGGERPGGTSIPAANVSAVLSQRFPHATSNEGTTFRFGKTQLITVGPEALQDYSDTIEPWRLLQTWASHHTDSNGRLVLSRQFDADALQVMYRFLRAYDLAILKHAKTIAQRRRLSTINAGAMEAAFELESTQEGASG